MDQSGTKSLPVFPFLFGGTFIEGRCGVGLRVVEGDFPSFFGGTFIEGKVAAIITWSEEISLPFRRDFH